MSATGPVIVGLGYPAEWDVRTPEVRAADMAGLTALDPRIEVVEMYGADAAAHRSEFSRVEVLLTMRMPDSVVALAPRLRWVHAIGAGVSHLPLAELATAGVRVSTSSGVNAVPVAEFALARLMAHRKRHRELDLRQNAHEWQPTYGTELAGTTLAVLGLGAIGQAVAVRAAAFGMRVLGVRRTCDPVPGVDEVLGTNHLHAILQRCDAVIACLPDTPQTAGLMDETAFAAMRPGAFFCNVGRGSLVDEAALVKALTSGGIGGAALDVTATEPLPPDDPLWDAPNLYLSPHSASSAATHFTGVHRLFRENLARYLAGRAPLNEIDPIKGY